MEIHWRAGHTGHIEREDLWMFTLHGATHEMTMDVHATAAEDRIHATIEFEIPNVAWGMKDPSNFLLKVDKTVRVTIDTAGPLQKH